MSQLSDAEVDASLYALGIGSDARGLRVLLIGHSGSQLTHIVQGRLITFGAQVSWVESSIEDPDMQVDYVIALPGENSVWNVARVVNNVLKPGGRYMILHDDLGDADALVGITDVTALGVSAVRVLGYKARCDGDGQ